MYVDVIEDLGTGKINERMKMAIQESKLRAELQAMLRAQGKG